MKEKTRDIFVKSERDYMCPVCQKSFHLEEQGSLRCGSGHCFDISAKGYINFIPSVKSEKYTKGLFESRKAVFGDGFYRPVAEAVRQEIEEFLKEREGAGEISIFDAGCGEGYYSLFLEREMNREGEPRIFAMDIVKDAIVLAAGKESRINWIVGDLTQIPLKRKKIDVLLNILTPANYGEFSRVLKDDGLFIKIIPGEHYLKEVRLAASGQLVNKTYSNQDVVDYFSEHMDFVEKKTIQYELPVSKEQFDHFLRMTPMTFGVDISALEAAYPRTITIHMEILTGRKSQALIEKEGTGNAGVTGEKPKKNRRRNQRKQAKK